MNFMLSNVRSSIADNRDDVDHHSSAGTKRKSLSFLPSSPTKLKRVDRSHSCSSSLFLLSTSSSISRLSSFSPSKRSRPSPKSPPTCTISLENVTVNAWDEGKNLSRTTPRTTPLESIDVNIIPFPTATSGESEATSPPGPPISRRRRSNHLLGHRRSSSVHTISVQRKENPSSPALSPRQPTSPEKPKCIPQGASSQPAKSSLSFKDIRFMALIRRSIMHGIVWRERMDRMDVDNDSGSGSVTYDILNDSECEEGDEPSQARFMHDQDVLLADRLGKHLADWGYHERNLTPTISSVCPLRMPLAPIALPAVTISPPSFSPIAELEPLMTALPSASSGSIPDLEGHATHVSFLNDVENIPMDVDVDQPERPISPVARCLEPMDENDAPISSAIGSGSSQKPILYSIPSFDPPSVQDDAHEFSLLGPHIREPAPVSSSPPLSTLSPGALSSRQRVLSPSHLVATLVMRHREKTALRSRGTPPVGNRAAGRGMRRPSPLACELWASVEK